MDAGQVSPVSPTELYGRLGNAVSPLIVDVRREPAFNTDEHMIAGAIRRAPDDVAQWRSSLPEGRAVVVYGVHGQEVSQGVATALRNQGVDARYLEGGIAAWNESKLPLRRKRGQESGAPSKWVTREHPKIDRIACPWLVSRFIDPL